MSEKTISLTNLERYKQDSDNLYAKQNGSYENMSVGNADNLTPYGPNSGSNDTTPFVFQSSGGGSDIGSLAQLKELRGNTVKFNQLVQNGNFSSTSRWATNSTYGSLSASSNVMTYTVVSPTSTLSNGQFYYNLPNTYGNSHKYLFKITVKPSFELKIKLSFDTEQATTISANTKTVYCGIFTSNSGTSSYLYIQQDTSSASANDTIEYENCQFIDLTQMFGAGNEPESVVEFNRLFPKSYYAYNTGTLLSCKSVAYKVVGFNQLETQPTISGGNVYTTGFIKVIAGQRYTFEIGEYQLSDGTAFGNMFFDEYDENKELIKSYNLMLNEQGEDNVNSTVNVGKHTLGNNTHYVKIRGYVASPKTITSISNCCFHLTWDGSKTGYEEYKSQTYQLPNVELRSAGSVYDSITPDGTLTRRIGVRAYQSGDEEDSSVITDLTYTYYVLTTPTTEQVSTFVENTSIDDWGTQEFVSNESIVVPQGCDFFYSVDYKAFIDSLGEREDIDYDASKLVSQTELQTAISQIPTGDFGFPIIPAPSSTTLTNDEVAKISGGCIINGTFLGLTNPVFLPTSTPEYNEITGFVYEGKGLGVSLNIYVINTNNKTIALYTGSQANRVLLGCIGRLNGISIGQYYKKPQSSVSLIDGGTITDSTLKTLIQNEQPIKLNGFTCYFSCDDGTNYQYVSTRYDSSANKNHINVITINKSTWVATFHTSDIAV